MQESFESLKQIRKKMKVSWYRCPIDRAELKKLTQRSDSKAWFQSIGHLVLLACTGFLSYFFFYHKIWIGLAVSLFAHGTIFVYSRA